MTEQNNIVKTLKGLHVTNGIAVGFSLIDQNMRIAWTNFTMQEWFGKNEDIIGKHCYGIYQKRKHLCPGCPTKKSFLTGKVQQAVQPGIDLDGKKCFYQLTATPIKDKYNKVIQVLEVVQNITTRIKQAKNDHHQLLGIKKTCHRLKQANRKLSTDRKRLRLTGKNTSLANEGLLRKYKTLFKKLSYTKRELHDLFIVNKMISSNGDSSKIIYLITKLAKHILHADAATVRYVDNENRILIPKSALGLGKNTLMETPLKIGEGLEGIAAKCAKVLICKDMRNDERVMHLKKVKEEGLRTALVVPAVFNHQSLAVISLFYHRVREFNEEEIELMNSFANQAAIAIQETKYCADVHINYFNTLKALVLVVEARDPFTCGHSERVTRYAVDLAYKLEVPDNLLNTIQYASFVHDVGKIGISDLILNKPGRLTTAERAIIELHPIKGAQMLEPLKFMKTGIPLVRHHHERFDGKGYPDRIGQEEIPLSARILSCADSFDAMTSDRPYRFKKMSLKEAVMELKANLGTQFDPKVTSVFLKLIKKKKYI